MQKVYERIEHTDMTENTDNMDNEQDTSGLQHNTQQSKELCDNFNHQIEQSFAAPTLNMSSPEHSKSTPTCTQTDNPKSPAPSYLRNRRRSLPTGKTNALPNNDLRYNAAINRKNTRSIEGLSLVSSLTAGDKGAVGSGLSPRPPKTTASYQGIQRRRCSLPGGTMIPGELSSLHTSPRIVSKNTKLGQPYVSAEDVSNINGNDISATPRMSFRNRRSSLPSNAISLTPRPRTSHLGRHWDTDTGKSLGSTTEPNTNTVLFTRLKRTRSLSENCRALADLITARSEAISRLSTNSTTNSKKTSGNDHKVDNDVEPTTSGNSPRTASQKTLAGDSNQVK